MTLRALNHLNVTKEVKAKLTAYSMYGLRGEDIVGRTPFYASTQLVYPNVRARISGIKGIVPPPYDVILPIFIRNIKDGVKDYPQILAFEESFEKYAGSSRSVVLPGAERKQKLLDSFKLQEQPLAVEVDPLKRRALERASTRLSNYIHTYIPRGSIRIGANLDMIIKRMKKNTNGGMPYLLRGKVVDPKTNDVLVDNTGKYAALTREIIALDNKEGGDAIPETGRMFIALNRTQEGADNTVKNRIVGGDAHACTILAGALYPLLDACKHLPSRKILLGLADLDAQLSYVVRHNTSYATLLSADQSAFDNHINAKLAKKYVLPIFYECLNFSSAPDMEKPVYDYLFKHVFDDPIVTPEGVYYGTHGMSSGVLVVNEIDSWYLLLLCFYLDELDGCNCRPIAVQGDDAVFAVSKSVKDTPKGFESRCKDLGLEANALKQGVSLNSCTFIKRLGTRETEHGYRSKIGSTIGLLNEERPQAWNEYMYEARAGAILSNHFMTDPGISDFFWQVTLGGKYKIGLDFKNGYYEILQLAGGVDKVSSELKLDSYSNMLAVSFAGDAGQLSVADMSIMKGQQVARGESAPERGFIPTMVKAIATDMSKKTARARKSARYRQNRRNRKMQ